MFRSTQQVANLLGIKTGRLNRAVWENRITPPPKSPGGDYLWDEKAIHHASWIIRHRDASDVLPASSDTTK
jgi:hypothetical protein